MYVYIYIYAYICIYIYIYIYKVRLKGFGFRISGFWGVGFRVYAYLLHRLAPRRRLLRGCYLTQCIHWLILESQIPHKTVNLTFWLGIVSNELTILWGRWLSKTHYILWDEIWGAVSYLRLKSFMFQLSGFRGWGCWVEGLRIPFMSTGALAPRFSRWVQVEGFGWGFRMCLFEGFRVSGFVDCWICFIKWCEIHLVRQVNAPVNISLVHGSCQLSLLQLTFALLNFSSFGSWVIDTGLFGSTVFFKGEEWPAEDVKESSTQSRISPSVQRILK
jgi:hypothetical protein